MTERVEAAERELQRDIGRFQATAKRGKSAAQRADASAARARAAEEAARLLAQFADERQERVLRAIEQICSAGLSSVFGESVNLHVKLTTRARRLEADVTVETAGLETEILSARGGGLAAVAGFLLRATTLLLTRGARPLIVADETFAHLSSEYAPRMADFLAELCEATKMQVVLVTHDASFEDAADRLVHLTRQDGKAVAEMVR